ncbi:MAG TPA: DUF4340 domain-containing protein [Pirellulales bacterium]
MKEGAKTLVFAVVTIALLGAAWITRPRPIVELTDSEAGELYPKFKDPLAAKSLEIISYDEDTAALEPFKVAQVNGRWAIPSHANYPADAASQLAAAATSMMDLQKLDVASSNPAEHELYGVIDPKSPNLSAGATGVGKRVTLQDGAGNTLADYIIGKSEEKQPGVRFVRIPGQDPVYRVLVSTDKLSTNFGDWIEKDLLKMNAFDVKQVVLNNHSVDEVNGTVRFDSIISVDYDSKESKWDLNDLRVGPRQAEAKLKPDEELNAEKLNDLKTALDDLKIVDVSRKPPGLSADLRVDEKSLKDSSKESLMQHGFFPARINGKLELVSNEGEVHCGMSDGVDYILRFGEIAGAGKKKDEKKDDKKDEKKDDKTEEAAGVNRYIMVATRFQKDLIPEPELEDVPALPAKAGPAAPAKTEPAAPAKTKAPQGETPQPPAAKTEKKPAAGKKPKAGNGAGKAKKPAADQPAGDGCDAAPAADDDAEKPADTDAADEKGGDKQPADAKPAAPKSAEELERDRVVQENKRKQDEYETKLKDGEKRVKELNDRFADWYYIISNETYQKIHLSRDQVIKQKEKPKDEAGAKPAEEAPKDPFQIQKFNELKSQGLPK